MSGSVSPSVLSDRDVGTPTPNSHRYLIWDLVEHVDEVSQLGDTDLQVGFSEPVLQQTKSATAGGATLRGALVTGIFHPSGPNLRRSRMLAWNRHKANVNVLNSDGLLQSFKNSSVNPRYDLVRFARNPETDSGQHRTQCECRIANL